ncbi:MAG: zeta toxin family protein [Bryobacteraceae bacterium]
MPRPARTSSRPAIIADMGMPSRMDTPVLIILAGLPGAGKTSIGRQLARQLAAAYPPTTRGTGWDMRLRRITCVSA